MTTRSCTGSLKPTSFLGYQTYTSTRHPFQAFHTILHEKEPSSFSKAITNSRWKVAMTQEFKALLANGTWTLCPRPFNHLGGVWQTPNTLPQVNIHHYLCQATVKR
jgi:hypothetical protein